MSQENQSKHAVVIYHANCADGFGAAWAFHKLKEKDYESVKYIPMGYGGHRVEIPEIKLTNTDLYILDFSFSREHLMECSGCFNTLTLLDHHKTAQADLEDWEDKPSNLEIVFDMTRSGAGITWDYFDKSKARFQLIDYIEDRDLWKFALHKCKEINAVIQNTDKTFEAYEDLAITVEGVVGRDTLIEGGRQLMKMHDRICADIVASATEINLYDLQGELLDKGLSANCTPHFASEVGNLLAKQSGTFGLTYHNQGKGVTKFSIRSTGDYDVSKFARQFGGGGHKNASGWELKEPLVHGSITLWGG